MSLRGNINHTFSKDFRIESKNSPDKGKSDNLSTNIKKNEVTKEEPQSMKPVL